MNYFLLIKNKENNIILKLHKKFARSGGLKLINLKEEVREVFDITGFTDFLCIE